MENFKLASKQRLRIQTNKGPLNVEQVWELTIPELDELAVSLEEQHKQSGKKSFVVKTTTKDKTTKLCFDIVLEILNTKMEEEQAAKEALEKKEHNQKIFAAMAENNNNAYKGKTNEELAGLLK